MNTSSKALWESLYKEWEDKSLVNKFFLRRKLHNFRMKDETFIHEHLNEFKSLVSELLGTGIKIDEEEHVCLLLFLM